MSKDISTAIFFNHQQMLTYKVVPRQLRSLTAWYSHCDPETCAAIIPTRDILDFWMPTDAGSGGLTIEAHGIGEFSINITSGVVMMEVATSDLLTQENGLPKTVFLASGSDLLTFSSEGMAYARRILRYVNLRHERYGEIAPIAAWWEQKLSLTPSPKWIALREAAIKVGHEPPRACHWMARENE